jgi:hypothetical protein
MKVQNPVQASVEISTECIWANKIAFEFDETKSRFAQMQTSAAGRTQIKESYDPRNHPNSHETESNVWISDRPVNRLKLAHSCSHVAAGRGLN